MTLSRPRFSRRDALALIAGTLAGAALPPLAWAAVDTAADAAPGTWPQTLEAGFAAFCDTLIPADELAPAASALGVPGRILGQAAANALFRRLVLVSVGWLDQQAGGRFADASPERREAIATTMSALPLEAPQRRFFDLIRDLAMGFYWSQPAAWTGLATEQPPQPAGYFEAVR